MPQSTLQAKPPEFFPPRLAHGKESTRPQSTRKNVLSYMENETELYLCIYKHALVHFENQATRNARMVQIWLVEWNLFFFSLVQLIGSWKSVLKKWVPVLKRWGITALVWKSTHLPPPPHTHAPHLSHIGLACSFGCMLNFPSLLNENNLVVAWLNTLKFSEVSAPFSHTQAFFWLVWPHPYSYRCMSSN